MEIEIGRNEPCPCGSGVKYKKCCLNKPDKIDPSDPEIFISEFDTIWKNRFVKQCVHPKKEECSEKIVRAHSIQNNRILTKLAVDGHVISLKQDVLFFHSGQKTGRKVASTFTGFCKHHDLVTFRDIENRAFEREPKQLFLFAYRAFALEFHRKIEQLQVFQTQFEIMPSMAHNKNQMTYYRSLQMGLNDNDQTKTLLDQGLMDERYDILNHVVWEIPFEIEFATSTAFGLHYDINGRQINNYLAKDRIRNLFVSIFPAEKRSFCLFSWLKDDDPVYSSFGRQFMKLSESDRKKYINNLLPLMTENIVLSPRLWEGWGQDKQKDFEALFHLSFIFDNSMYKNMVQETHFDLFN